MRRSGPQLLLLLWLCWGGQGAARGAAPHLRAVQLPQGLGDAGRPVIDGLLSEPAWRTAPGISGFLQKQPNPGRPATEITIVRVLYDDEALYVGFECPQRARIVRQLTRRDRLTEADMVSFIVDTRGDGQTAFEFFVSAASVLVDGLHYNDTEFSSDWDENWEARAARTKEGWSAELRIPLRILRFPALPVQSWGFQARRNVSAKQLSEWAFIPRDVAGEVSRYGRLDDLRRLRSPSPLELRPFVVGRLRRLDAAEGFLRSGLAYSASAGLDLKLHLSQSLTLDATLNPDFGQVEADQVVLNLTNFEYFLPEKRPFFLEGIETFTTPLQVLYTRRIGSAPPLPFLDVGEQPLARPDPSPIYVALKLQGTLGRGLSVGLLGALTGRNDLLLRLPAGQEVARLADPLTLFSALRLRYAPVAGSWVGLMLTSVARFEPDDGATGDPKRCPGSEEQPAGARCTHDAHTFSLDWSWRSGAGYVVGGQALLSAIVAGPARTLLDGTVIGASDVAPGALLRLAKEGGKHLIGDVTYRIMGRKTDLNDLGYMERQNEMSLRANLELRHLEPFGKVLEAHARLEFFYRANLDGLTLARGYHLNSQWKWSSFWSLFSDLQYREPSYDDREVGDGTALERGGRLGLILWAQSDPRKPVFGEMFASIQRIWDGFNFELDASINFRLIPQLELELLPQVVYTFGEPRYVGPGSSGERLFGRLRAQSVGATLRATYTFTPQLTLQLYAQLILAARRYEDFSVHRGAGRVVRLADLESAAPPLESPDSAETVLNLNVTLRWEFTLGSTLYLVYTRNQLPASLLQPGELAGLDLGLLHRGPAADAFLMKFAYWFG